MEKRYSPPQLNGLKGLFSLVIVLFHTLPETRLIDQIPLTSFVRLYGGSLGNSMFFLLSGFLMSMGYRNRIQSHEITAKEFLWKRLCRLYPLYILTCFLDLVYELLAFGPSGFNLKKLAFTVLMQSGGGLDAGFPYNYPAWFLSALLACYLLFYFIAYHAKHRTQYCCMVAACIVWGYSVIQNGSLLGICLLQNGQSLMNFFIGCALAEGYPFLSDKIKKWMQPACVCLLIGSALLLLRFGVEIICGDSNVAFAFVICPLILYLALDNALVRVILMSRPIQYLGKISFSIYLWHIVVYNYFMHLRNELFEGRGGEEGWYLAYLLLVAITSILSYNFIENRTRRKTHDPEGATRGVS